MIEKKTIQLTKQKLISPAQVKYEDTGEFEIVKIKDINGNVTEKEKPVKKEVNIPARYEEVIEEKEVFEYNDGVDTHQFASMKEAKAFMNGKG